MIFGTRRGRDREFIDQSLVFVFCTGFYKLLTLKTNLTLNLKLSGLLNALKILECFSLIPTHARYLTCCHDGFPLAKTSSIMLLQTKRNSGR